MGQLIAKIFSWITNKFLIFLFVLALLVGFQLLKEQYQAYIDNNEEVVELENEIQILTASIDSLIKKGLPAKIKKTYDSYARKIKKSRKSITKLERDIARIRKKHPVGAALPISKHYKEIAVKKAAIKAARKSIRSWDSARKKIAKAHSSEVDKLQKEVDELERSLIETREERDSNFLSWFFQQLNQHLYSALAIVIGLIMVPVLIKLLFYFVLAPLASRCQPIQLVSDPERGVKEAPSLERGSISAKSLEIVLPENRELIVLPEYLNSLTTGVTANTRYFLSSSTPLSSIASGLFLLTRIVSTDKTPIVLSSSRHALIDLGIITLEENMAVVCFPRSLVGVIKNTGSQLKITKHWRLNSLHGWLTLQLRYLVFHGPCDIIVKGCRGVRVEDAGQGRIINQAATLGFSANLEYRNTRCETFFPYWTGASDLLNDQFEGDNGFFFYEEMPDQNRKSGITGRGLEGFTDSVLKAFGI